MDCSTNKSDSMNKQKGPLLRLSGYQKLNLNIAADDLKEIKFLLSYNETISEEFNRNLLAHEDQYETCLQLWSALTKALNDNHKAFWDVIQDVLYLTGQERLLKELNLRWGEKNRFYHHEGTFGFGIDSKIPPFRVMLYKLVKQMDVDLKRLQQTFGQRLTTKPKTDIYEVLLKAETEGKLDADNLSDLEEYLSEGNDNLALQFVQSFRNLNKNQNTVDINYWKYTYFLPKDCKKRSLIFNYNEFNDPRYEKRFGSEDDVNAITTTLENLHFYVETYSDQNESQTKDIVNNKLSTMDFLEADIFVVVVMSHGYYDEATRSTLVISKDIKYMDTKNTFVSPFLNETLREKPKIFIFQCCRGNKTPPNTPTSTEVAFNFDASKIQQPVKILPQSDPPKKEFGENYAQLFATFETNKAVRNWFIPSFCDAIDKSKKTDEFQTIWYETLDKMKKIGIEKNCMQSPQYSGHMFPLYLKLNL